MQGSGTSCSLPFLCFVTCRCLLAFCRCLMSVGRVGAQQQLWPSPVPAQNLLRRGLPIFRFIHSFDPHFVNYIHIHLIWKQHPPTRLILVPIISNASILLALRSVNFPLWRALGSGLLVLVCQFHHLAESEQRRLSCCAGILVSISFSMPSTTGWTTFAIATIFSRRGHRCR